MDQPDHLTPCHMTTVTGRIVNHAIYEYDKGVRALFMVTMDRADLPAALARLAHARLATHVHAVGNAKVNLFFGRTAHVDCVRSFVDRPLSELTPHEDFMLGTLLGYDRERQCERFLERLGRTSRAEASAARGSAGWDRLAAGLC
jgi:hypothetical protein